MPQNLSITDEDWLALKPKLEKSFKEFHGDSTVFESAWGAVLFGTQMGWKVLFLMHNQATIKKYERITGVKFREVCPDTTKWLYRSNAYKIASGLSSLWKAIRGEESIPNRTKLGASK